MCLSVALGGLVVGVVRLVPPDDSHAAVVAAEEAVELEPVFVTLRPDAYELGAGCACKKWLFLRAWVEPDATELTYEPGEPQRFANPLSLAALAEQYGRRFELFAPFMGGQFLFVSAAPDATAGDLMQVFDAGRALGRGLRYELPPTPQTISLDAPPRTSDVCVRIGEGMLRCGGEVYVPVTPWTWCSLEERLAESQPRLVRIVGEYPFTARDLHDLLFTLRNSPAKVVWDPGDEPLPGYPADEDFSLY